MSKTEEIRGFDVVVVDDVQQLDGATFIASAAGWKTVEFRGRLYAAKSDQPFCEVVNFELRPVRLVKIEG